MATPGPINPDAVSTQAKRLINMQLKAVLKSCNLPVSGAKAAMQQRIISEVHRLAQTNNVDGFNRIRDRIYHPEPNPSGQSPSPQAVRTFQNDSRPQQNSYGQSFAFGQGRPVMPTTNGTALRTPVFKTSPFYTVIQALTQVLEIKVREQTRDSVSANINLRPETAERLNNDPGIRVMIYCAPDSMQSPFQKVDIAFPYQVEIKVNQDEVKANLRGLKNKPGSTRPADITSLLRKRAGYENHLQITYALTNKRFFVVANLVRSAPVRDLVATLKAGKTISKERVMREMISRAEDTDIVATSSILSLKCPLSTLRIDVPCRSTLCTHNQCFDASSFLQLQEQAPTWTCPICNKMVLFENLQVDQYVDDILKSTPKSVDQVIIEPNANWSPTSNIAPAPSKSNGRGKSSDGEDDLIEIRDLPQVANVKREATSEGSVLRSPPISSREQSTSSGVQPPPSSNKRSSGQVVDLTLSSDEEEEPLRPAKRQLTHRPSNTLPPIPALDDVPTRINGISHEDSGSQLYSANPLPTSSSYASRSWGPNP